MTDGTSQGLFIVVAIVIFGIFTLMAYILFEDTLSPALASMFNEAIEQSHKNLNNEIDFWDHLGGVNIYSSTLTKTKDTVVLNSTGEIYASVFLSSKALNPQTKYKLSFDMDVLDGIMTHIGGHMSSSEHVKVKINGVVVEDTKLLATYTGGEILDKNKWNMGIPLDGSNTYRIEILFDTNFYGIKFPYSRDLDDTNMRSFYIDGNRHNYGTGDKTYTMEISNMVLEKR